jgi:purine-nucleoside phosphorylase
VAEPVRIAADLGATTLIVSNASGGVNRSFRAGDLMLIDDHINMLGDNPLFGAVKPGELRFPDMSQPYDRELRALARRVALAHGVQLVEGTYLAATGPTYETPAEVSMYERIGVDAVGMSTVPEVIAARARGMRVLGFSLITNLAAGYTSHPLSHTEVIEAGARATAALGPLIRGIITAL